MTVPLQPFGFTAPWFALGLVTETRLAELLAEWARGEDRSTEHYRWRAFTAFLAEHRPLPPDTAVALYDLGAADDDRAMGEAMMHTIIRLPECPGSLVAIAASSGVRHLERAAAHHDPAS